MKKFFLSTLNLTTAFLILTAGCSGVVTRSATTEIKTFFLAGQEARLTGLKQNLCPEKVDLSAYAHLMEIKYPPTSTVEVLKDPPVRAHVIFAVLQWTRPPEVPCDDPRVVEGFKTKAQAVGADAIIICKDSHGAKNNLEVLAVKYKLE
ncbi:MAG: hypothetical protein FJ134_02890 [Deltaproteobacteria bacterium]|nr:hypothetical protein [Deltaproteobacteria bacterium]